MKNGTRPAHLIPWAPADYLTSRTRMRAITTSDHMLRLVYREALDVLYTEGGAVTPEALLDLTSLPRDEVDRCVAACVALGSLVLEEGLLSNPRVTRTLEGLESLRERRANGGKAGAAFAYLGARERESRKHPLKGIDASPSGIGIYVSPSVPSVEKEGARTTWLTPFMEAWEQALGGAAPAGQIAKEFKGPVDRLGGDAVLAGWRKYLAETEGRFVSASAFAKKIGLWVRKAPPRPKPIAKLAPPDAKVCARWAQARERIEMPAHLKRTWLSPVGGQSLSLGTLLLVVPSKEHAEAVLRYKDKIMAAYNGVAPGEDFAPVQQVAAVVVAPDATVHDGGL